MKEKNKPRKLSSFSSEVDELEEDAKKLQEKVRALLAKAKDITEKSRTPERERR